MVLLRPLVAKPVFLAVLACWFISADAHAAFIVNGDFETVAAGAEPKQTFTGWTETGGTVGSVGTVAPTALSGSSSLLMNAPAFGSITQVLSTPITSAPFDVSLVFSLVNPTDLNVRSLNMFLIGPSGAGSGQINLRVIETSSTGGLGDIQVYDGSNFITILSNVVLYSPTLSSPVLNTLSISGTFGAAASSYVVTVNGNSSLSQTRFQGRPESFTSLQFATVNGNGNATYSYVLDNVVVTPEPSKALLMCFAVMGILAQHRRRNS